MEKWNTGKLIAGALLLGEGAAVALYGRRYLKFMERNGLMNAGRAALNRLDIQSSLMFGIIGIAEAAWGLSLLSKAKL